MDHTNIHERISEIRLLLREQDISRATRRLLDLFVDFPGYTDLGNEALTLRSDYNSMSNETQGGNEAQKDLLLAKLESLLQKLEAAAQGGPATGEQFQSNTPGSSTDIVFRGTGIGKIFTTGANSFKLAPIDLLLKLGELTGIVGENGNGKTTLLRIVAGDLGADSGTIEYPYFGLTNTDWYEVKHRIAYIPQRLPKWHGLLIDNLRFAAAIHGIKGEENESRVDFIIERLGLSRFRYHKWSEISSGYRLRFELAKVLVWSPKLLVLDEPLANLDINAQQLFLQDLKYIAKSLKHPVSVLLSSQQLHEIESVSDNIIFLKAGETLYNGTQKSFGQQRNRNCFEVVGSFDRAELITMLEHIPGVKVDDSGTALIINAPVEITSDTILRSLLEKNASIHYFRDISTSTKKLFRQEI